MSIPHSAIHSGDKASRQPLGSEEHEGQWQVNEPGKQTASRAVGEDESAGRGLLKKRIEAVLFISPRAITARRLASLLEADEPLVKGALSELAQEYSARGGGLMIAENEEEVQMMTSADVSSAVQKFLKDETTGELTRPSLETLTIIAYRGPIARADLEKIRGVNCSIILRHLMIRGLVEAREDKKRLVTFYTISMDFLRFLGIQRVSDLPNYDFLHGHKVVQQYLRQEESSGELEDDSAI